MFVSTLELLMPDLRWKAQSRPFLASFPTTKTRRGETVASQHFLPRNLVSDS